MENNRLMKKRSQYSQIETSSTIALHSKLSVEEENNNYKGRVQHSQHRASIAYVIENQAFSHYLSKINKIAIKRIRYPFQLLKQFYLFPNQSNSTSLSSINPYDRLIFNDEALHSMVKIIETKEIEMKIWAIINLKFIKKTLQIKQFIHKIMKFQRTAVFYLKASTFSSLKDLNIKFLKLKNLQLLSKNEENMSRFKKDRSNVKISKNTIDMMIKNYQSKNNFDLKFSKDRIMQTSQQSYSRTAAETDRLQIPRINIKEEYNQKSQNYAYLSPRSNYTNHSPYSPRQNTRYNDSSNKNNERSSNVIDSKQHSRMHPYSDIQNSKNICNSNCHFHHSHHDHHSYNASHHPCNNYHYHNYSPHNCSTFLSNCSMLQHKNVYNLQERITYLNHLQEIYRQQLQHQHHKC